MENKSAKANNVVLSGVNFLFVNINTATIPGKTSP